MSGSILEKVLSSQQSVALEQFNPSDVVAQLLKILPTKDADVLRRRLGLDGSSPETLEQIGKTYGVTRERIRQIERAAKTRLLQDRVAQEILHPVEHMVVVHLTGCGGITEHETFFHHFLQYSVDSAANRQSFSFLLEELFSDKVASYHLTDEFRSAWHLKLASLELTREIIAKLRDVIERHGHPMGWHEVLQAFRETPFAQEHATQLNDDTVLASLGVSQALGRNPFGDYGLSSWGSIIPRRMNDKIYLVLRKHGKPLHFNEITRLINEAGFGDHQAYAPTVHNELILNDQYVLVGRGIYALREWGYQPGVVADVLEHVLREAGEPLSREELVRRVFAQRLVKKNTIHLALSNRSRFTKRGDGRYELATTGEPGAHG